MQKITKSNIVSALLTIAVIALVAPRFMERITIPEKQDSGFPSSPLDATYIIDGVKITFTKGRAEQPVRPDSQEKIVTGVFGAPASWDLTGDGRNDAPLLLVRTGVGSSTFYYAAAAIQRGDGYVGLNAITLGDRIRPLTLEIDNKFSDSFIISFLDRKKGEPLTATPSVRVTKTFHIQNGMVSEVIGR